MAIRQFRASLVWAVCLAALSSAWASAPFDLTGPTLEVEVTRGTKTLPISEVPNLQAGDHVWIRADLPEAQSARYLMIAAFMRGSTNPPPARWFFRQETWDRRADEKGMTITVPEGAQQVVIFLAPETNGDYRTLVNAVQGQPGAFVRSSQDLNQAMLDRTRLDAYLAAIRSLNESDPARLATATPLLARSLGMKINPDCLQEMPELQAACLTQGQDTMILSDGHSESIVEALTSGPESDLAMQLSSTPQADYGFYSPYVGSVMDIARILDGFRTAQYQYIPALAVQQGDQLALMLNTPPSFHNPKSVLVTALPAVEASQLPPLHPVDSQQNYCAEKNSLVLAVDGAPLVFSTGYAHQLNLRLKTRAGKYLDVPLQPDAKQGGLVLEAKDLSANDFPPAIDASLEGYWGFSKFDGPAFRLQNTHTQHWQLAAADRESLIVGKVDTIQLSADDASCVDTILLKDSGGKEIKAAWKITSPDQLQVTLPLQKAEPGPMLLEVKQYGAVTAQTLPLRAFAEAGRLDSFTLHAGDSQGVLKGSRLDEVASLTLDGLTFTPGQADSTTGSDELPLVAKNPAAAAKLKQGQAGTALVALDDGRELTVDAVVGAPRPSVELIGKSVQDSDTDSSNIALAGQDELPQNALLTFSLRAQSPARFGMNEQIEVATQDEGFTTTLSLANGGMTLENSQVALATLDPAKAFGDSAFGPLKFRVVDRGSQGDWQSLATLVRLPALHDLKCPEAVSQQCRLSGSNLFLVDAIATNPEFTGAVEVPDGFPGYVLPVPHPQDGQLYVKLRDDPSVVNQITLAAQELPVPSGQPPAPPRAAYIPDQAAPAPGAPGLTSTSPVRAETPSQSSPNAGTAKAAPGEGPGGSPANSGAEAGSSPRTQQKRAPSKQKRPQEPSTGTQSRTGSGSGSGGSTQPQSGPGGASTGASSGGSASGSTTPGSTAALPPRNSTPPQF
jgi:hypothetical protein